MAKKIYYDEDFTGLIGEYYDETTSQDRKEALEEELRESCQQVIARHPEWANLKPIEIYDKISENY